MDLVKKLAVNALAMAAMLLGCVITVPPIMYGLHKVMSPEAAMVLVFVVGVVAMTLADRK